MFPCAQCVAKIGGIEISNGEWLDLIPMLLTHAGNPHTPPGPMHAVLMTLGYLLEEIVRLTLTHTHTHPCVLQALLVHPDLMCVCRAGRRQTPSRPLKSSRCWAVLWWAWGQTNP